MVGGLSVTAAQSRRNTAPKGGRRGNWKGIILLYLQDHQGSLSQLDYSGGIMHNWLVRCWVSAVLRMRVYDKTITFQIAGRVSSVFEDHHKCIGAVSPFHGSTDELWNVLKVSRKVCVRACACVCCWPSQSAGHLHSFSPYCNSFDKAYQNRHMIKGPKFDYTRKNKCLSRVSDVRKNGWNHKGGTKVHWTCCRWN